MLINTGLVKNIDKLNKNVFIQGVPINMGIQ